MKKAILKFAGFHTGNKCIINRDSQNMNIRFIKTYLAKSVGCNNKFKVTIRMSPHNIHKDIVHK